MLHSPWNEEFIARKLQIASRIPASDKAQGRGLQHFVSRAELDARYESEALRSSNLCQQRDYQIIMAAWDTFAHLPMSQTSGTPLLGMRYGTQAQTPMQMAIALLELCLRQPDQPFAAKLLSDLCRNQLDRQACDPAFLTVYALQKLCAQEFESAERLLLQALACQPDYACALYNLAVLYQRCGRASDAQAPLHRACALEPRLLGLDGLHPALL